MPAGLAKGEFGPRTRTALRAYQAAKGIPQTGYVGPKTLTALNADLGSSAQVGAPAAAQTSSGAFGRDLQAGMTGADVKTLQVYLNAKGFIVAGSGPGSVGSETTRFGEATKAALVKLQKAAGIAPASGYFGAKTRAYVNAHP